MASSFSLPCRSWGGTQSPQARGSLKVHWEHRGQRLGLARSTVHPTLLRPVHHYSFCTSLQSWVLARLLLPPDALPQGLTPCTRLPESLPPPSQGDQVPSLHSDFSMSPQCPFPPSSVPLIPCSSRSNHISSAQGLVHRGHHICWKSRGWWAPLHPPVRKAHGYSGSEQVTSC